MDVLCLISKDTYLNQKITTQAQKAWVFCFIVKTDKDMEKLKRIEKKKESIGNRNERKLRRFNDKFNEIFVFFFQSYKKDILTFSGSEDFQTIYDKGKECSRECFRKFDNGQYSNKDGLISIPTKHNNILYCVIKGKKSWGLSVKEWGLGISECNFTIEEILKQFEDENITVPNSMITELENNVKKMKRIRNEKELERLKK